MAAVGGGRRSGAGAENRWARVRSQLLGVLRACASAACRPPHPAAPAAARRLGWWLEEPLTRARRVLQQAALRKRSSPPGPRSRPGRPDASAPGPGGRPTGRRRSGQTAAGGSAATALHVLHAFCMFVYICWHCFALVRQSSRLLSWFLTLGFGTRANFLACWNWQEFLRSRNYFQHSYKFFILLSNTNKNQNEPFIFLN